MDPLQSGSTRKPKQFRNILNKIMSHPELMLTFVSNLTPTSLVNLYAISKPFHYLFNKHYTTFVLANVRTYCGHETERIFPYSAYRSLCKLDPIRRDMNANVTVKSASMSSPSCSTESLDANMIRESVNVNQFHMVINSNPTDHSGTSLGQETHSQMSAVRQIPGIKWMTMVTHHVSTIRQIIALLSVYNHLLPFDATTLMLQKLWFLIDLQSNGARIGYVQNRTAWTDTDLKVAWYFFTRLDMHFTDPLDGNGSLSLRKLLLRQGSLTPLLETLKRNKYLSHLELLLSVVRTCRGVTQARHGHTVFGLQPHVVGRGEHEWHDRGANRLVRSDQLIMMEMLRRRLNPAKLVMPYMLAGRSRLMTLRQLPPVRNAVR